MTLQNWLRSGWIKEEKTSPAEIRALREKIGRDIATARLADVTADWRLAIAYNACLACAHTALRATGFRLPEDQGHHYRTIESLRHTLATDHELIITLHAVRKKRHTVTYDAAGTVSDTEVAEVLEIAHGLQQLLDKWLTKDHPDLLG
jgi:hypothetical protein